MDFTKSNKDQLFSKARTEGVFGKASQPNKQFMTSGIFGVSNQFWSAGGNPISSINGASRDQSVFTSKTDPMDSPRNRPKVLFFSQPSAFKFSNDMEESIIFSLSEKRGKAYENLLEIDRRQKKEIRTQKIDVDMEENKGTKKIEFRSRIDVNKEYDNQNLLNLQDLRDVLNEHIGKGHDSKNDRDMLNEMVLVSSVFFAHFVEQVYQPVYARLVLQQLLEAKRKDDDIESYTWKEKLFYYLSGWEFEKAAQLFDQQEESFNKSDELLEEIYKIILPIKNYFREGIFSNYQFHEVSGMFENMRQNAKALEDLSDNFIDVNASKILKLLSGEIEILSPTPLEHLYLHLIYQNQFPSQEDKEKIKIMLFEQNNKEEDADKKKLIDLWITLALDSPYDTFNIIKKSYPLWFSENLVFMWDASGKLNSETFKMNKGSGEEINTKIIEYASWEYVEYLLSK